jgi:hypothetical protein
MFMEAGKATSPTPGISTMISSIILFNWIYKIITLLKQTRRQEISSSLSGCVEMCSIKQKYWFRNYIIVIY